VGRGAGEAVFLGNKWKIWRGGISSNLMKRRGEYEVVVVVPFFTVLQNFFTQVSTFILVAKS
jgi:hypothetical protein